MYPSLGLGGGDTLHAVHARFVFEGAIHLLSRYRADDLFEAACGAFAGARYFEFPPFHFAIFGIHAEEVAGKEGGFVAACPAAYFEYGVAVVLRVGGHEQEFYLLFECRYPGLALVELLPGHFPHFGVAFAVEYFAGFIDVSQQAGIAFAGVVYFFEVAVFFGEFGKAFAVVDDFGVGDKCAYFLKTQ